jgi:hypothetical protein
MPGTRTEKGDYLKFSVSGSERIADSKPLNLVGGDCAASAELRDLKTDFQGASLQSVTKIESDPRLN